MSRTAPRPLESICGMWKRCLQTRMLDDFALDQDDNILVSIEKVDSNPQTSKLRFSFGKSPDSMRTGYSVEPIIDPTVGAPRVVPLRVSYSGQDCFGVWQPELGTLMVHLIGSDETANILYHFLDDDTISATITELKPDVVVASAGVAGASGGGTGPDALPGPDSLPPRHNKLQYGFLFRMRPGMLAGT